MYQPLESRPGQPVPQEASITVPPAILTAIKDRLRTMGFDVEHLPNLAQSIRPLPVDLDQPQIPRANLEETNLAWPLTHIIFIDPYNFLPGDLDPRLICLHNGQVNYLHFKGGQINFCQPRNRGKKATRVTMMSNLETAVYQADNTYDLGKREDRASTPIVIMDKIKDKNRGPGEPPFVARARTVVVPLADVEQYFKLKPTSSVMATAQKAEPVPSKPAPALEKTLSPAEQRAKIALLLPTREIERLKQLSETSGPNNSKVTTEAPYPNSVIVTIGPLDVGQFESWVKHNGRFPLSNCFYRSEEDNPTNKVIITVTRKNGDLTLRVVTTGFGKKYEREFEIFSDNDEAQAWLQLVTSLSVS